MGVRKWWRRFTEPNTGAWAQLQWLAFGRDFELMRRMKPKDR